MAFLSAIFEARGSPIKYLWSRMQIKDSGLTKGDDDKTSPFLAVEVSFRVHLKR